MRTDKLMINADPETMAAFKRALAYKVAAAFTLVFFFAVIAVTAPVSSNSNSSMTPSAVVPPANASTRHSVDFGGGLTVDDGPTRGVDMHG